MTYRLDSSVWYAHYTLDVIAQSHECTDFISYLIYDLQKLTLDNIHNIFCEHFQLTNENWRILVEILGQRYKSSPFNFPEILFRFVLF